MTLQPACAELLHTGRNAAGVVELGFLSETGEAVAIRLSPQCAPLALAMLARELSAQPPAQTPPAL
jgi:hypothetical protein